MAISAGCEQVLGAEHPAALAVRHYLADWTGKAGNTAGACDQYAALLPTRERVLGREHPDTRVTRADLAHWTIQAAEETTGRQDRADQHERHK